MPSSVGRRAVADFRSFVFTSTGDATNLRSVSLIDLLDNLAGEVERLRAIEDLLESSSDELGHEAVQGLAHLIGDVRRRVAAMLHLAAQAE